MQPGVPKWQAVGEFWKRHWRAPESSSDNNEIAEILAARTCDAVKANIMSAAAAPEKRRFAIFVSHVEAEAPARPEAWGVKTY